MFNINHCKIEENDEGTGAMLNQKYWLQFYVATIGSDDWFDGIVNSDDDEKVAHCCAIFLFYLGGEI